MKLIVEELRGTSRKIVTNLAIIPENLAEMLHDKYGDSFDLLNRLHLIEDSEIEFFYCHRGLSTGALKLEVNAKGKPEKFDIGGAQETGGVFYILDEVHLSFGARNWQNMGNACIYYASQHRKLGDDVILITQAPKMVDTTFRNLAQDYTVLRNHGLETLMFFKAPKVFSRQTFLNLPTANETPMEKGTFRLDMDVANCYDTSQGVGIHSRGDADTTRDTRKGFPWYVGVGVFIALIAVGSQIPSACGKFVAGEVMEFSDDVTSDRNASEQPVDNNESISTDDLPVITVANMSTNASEFIQEPQPEQLVVSGFLMRGSHLEGTFEFKAVLSDGSVLSLQKGELSDIQRSHVVDNKGRTYRFESGGPDISRYIQQSSREGEGDSDSGQN
tara:strand:- start:2080 stop:3243 length:1164 start_codon:yes stop_codon:yes gene_type:complete